jgi:GT2 family glycosyltransferase
VVVPFVGPPESLEALRRTLSALRLRAGDSVLIVDNTPGRGDDPDPDDAHPPVLRASQRATPGYARNRGARRGQAEWLLFLDADTEPPDDLLDRYFIPHPDPGTGAIGGGVRDEPVPAGGPWAARYAYLRAAMSQDDTFRFGEWGFPKTANAAFRREAFEGVGGFREDIRTAEDADLSFRLRDAGWNIERREAAAVTHRSRQTLGSFVVQRSLYGAGGAWLERQYPGSFPARRRPGLVWWAIRSSSRALGSALHARDRDRAIWAVCEPLELLAWEFGRSLPNERPLTLGSWLRAVKRLWAPRGRPRL